VTVSCHSARAVDEKRSLFVQVCGFLPLAVDPSETELPILFTPRSLQSLHRYSPPAGTKVAGLDLHPLKDRAFAQRTRNPTLPAPAQSIGAFCLAFQLLRIFPAHPRRFPNSRRTPEQDSPSVPRIFTKFLSSPSGFRCGKSITIEMVVLVSAGSPKTVLKAARETSPLGPAVKCM